MDMQEAGHVGQGVSDPMYKCRYKHGDMNKGGKWGVLSLSTWAEQTDQIPIKPRGIHRELTLKPWP